MYPDTALVVLVLVVVAASDVTVAVVVANTAATCLDSGNLRVSFQHKKHNWLHTLSRSLSLCLPFLLFASLTIYLSPSITQLDCSLSLSPCRPLPSQSLSSLKFREQLISLRCHFPPPAALLCHQLLPWGGTCWCPSPSLHACVKRHSIMAYLMRKFCLH